MTKRAKVASKTKWTPGPWAPSRDNPRIVVAGGARLDVGAVCDCYGGRTEDEHQANRRLIAAAPALVAACETARTSLLALGAWDDPAMRSILAALALVTGE